MTLGQTTNDPLVSRLAEKWHSNINNWVAILSCQHLTPPTIQFPPNTSWLCWMTFAFMRALLFTFLIHTKCDCPFVSVQYSIVYKGLFTHKRKYLLLQYTSDCNYLKFSTYSSAFIAEPLFPAWPLYLQLWRHRHLRVHDYTIIIGRSSSSQS